jgi:hypothetical protein
MSLSMKLSEAGGGSSNTLGFCARWVGQTHTDSPLHHATRRASCPQGARRKVRLTFPK